MPITYGTRGCITAITKLVIHHRYLQGADLLELCAEARSQPCILIRHILQHQPFALHKQVSLAFVLAAPCLFQLACPGGPALQWQQISTESVCTTSWLMQLTGKLLKDANLLDSEVEGPDACQACQRAGIPPAKLCADLQNCVLTDLACSPAVTQRQLEAGRTAYNTTPNCWQVMAKVCAVYTCALVGLAASGCTPNFLGMRG